MSSYFRIRTVDAPWGDYGDILINGLAEPIHDKCNAKRISLSRTGPFVPPITQPFGQVVLVDDLRRELESAAFTGFEFVEVELTKAVRCDWHTWDRDAEEPARYPVSGEPEDYVLKRSHDAGLVDEMPRLWALSVQSTQGLQVWGTSTFYLNRHPRTDIAREDLVFWISEALKDWLQDHAGPWVDFSLVTPR